MNNFIGKFLGIILFFVAMMFVFGFYISQNKANEFNQVTNEMNQLLEESGGFYASDGKPTVAIKYKKQISDTLKTEKKGYYELKNVKVIDGKTDTVKVNNLSLTQATGTNGILKAGDKIQVTYNYNYNGTGFFTWKPEMTKTSVITNYRR